MATAIAFAVPWDFYCRKCLSFWILRILNAVKKESNFVQYARIIRLGDCIMQWNVSRMPLPAGSLFWNIIIPRLAIFCRGMYYILLLIIRIPSKCQPVIHPQKLSCSQASAGQENPPSPNSLPEDCRRTKFQCCCSMETRFARSMRRTWAFPARIALRTFAGQAEWRAKRQTRD